MTGSSPIWHPFTQHALRPTLPQVAEAQGAYLYLQDGRRVLDAISSWWVITHGHCHPTIMAAIRAQAETLDQVIFAEYTHAAAEQLAAKLLTLAPEVLTRVFFCDSGSIAVEVAIKMALGFWQHSGEPRHRLVVLEGSYHGDTIGAMSVGARGPFTDSYQPLLFQVDRIPFPGQGQESATLEAFVALCRGNSIAALMVEPLVQGASGMRMYSADCLKQLRDLCTSHGVLFIADEIMTGWGRTGTRFACEQAGISPDIVCYSKGLTGGALPLAVTLCSEAIYQAHYSTDRRKTFFHSSSFTANPLACAAALANLQVWETEPVLERIAALSRLQSTLIQPFRDDGRFERVRHLGTITALDLKADDAGYLSTLGPKLQAHFRAANILLRPLGSTIYVLPPYCVSAEDLRAIYDAITTATLL